MANPIPPLVCSTPPPIDDLDEVSQMDDRIDTDYGEYEANTDIEFGSSEGPSLPNTPRHINITDISEDIQKNLRSNDFDSNNLEGFSSQTVTNYETETSPIEIAAEDVAVSITKISLKECKPIEENDDSISIEIEKPDEVKEDESNGRQSEPFACRWEKYESPPSLELTLQVTSEENDSFEKISNDGKEFEKDFNGKLSVMTSESLTSKDIAEEISIASKIYPQNGPLEFDSFLKDTEIESVLNTEKITNTDNEIETKINRVDTRSPKEFENDKGSFEIFPKTYVIHEKVSDFNSVSGCEMTNNESIEKKCVPADNLVFEADFSQFEDTLPPNTDKIEDNYSSSEYKIKKNVALLSENFPNFQNLELANKKISSTLDDDIESRFSNSNSISQLEIGLETEKDDDFDEEFGEFSDFKEAPITSTDITTNLETENACNPKKTETFSSILDTMFPAFENYSINITNNDNKSIKELAENYSILKNFDSANALSYQWNSSNTRHSLIKSLGIDSRNILYGEKWNCSMPKFASNLGFTPLEPLKPAKVENKNQHLINSTMPNSCNGTNKHNIPDAEFDWNSSGLINPLDGNKKQFEEKQNFEIHTTTNESGEVNSSTEPSKIENESTEANVSTEYEIRTEKVFNDIEFISSLSSSHNENNTTEFTVCSTAKSELSNDDDDDNSTKSKTASVDIELPSLSKASSTSGKEKLPIVDISLEANTISVNSKPILSTNIPSQLSINENTSKLNENFIQQLNSYSNDYINMGPPPTTYVVPLKETHIFTPTKSDNPISQSTGGDFRSTCNSNSNINNPSGGIACGIVDTIDFDYETAAAGTKINEKVIKKEYHDVEYDPGKFRLKPIDLQLTDNIGVNNAQTKSKNIKGSDNSCLDINDLGKNKNLKTGWTFHLNNCNNPTENLQTSGSEILNTTDRSSPTPFTFTSNQSIKAHTTDTSINYPHNVSDMPNDIMMSNDNKKFAVDFKDIKNSETTNNEKTQTLNVINFIENPSNLSKNTCDSLDDEFTDFQSVLPSPEYKNNFALNKKREDKYTDINSTSGSILFKESDKSRNQTPTLPSDDRMILSPAILLPQSVSVSHSRSLNETPKIEWPEPGISNDELARLENFFPQMKSSPVINMDNTSNNDEDWSDFMSVPPLPQSNLTQKSNQSPKAVHNESNLNIIYNPQSPTKVSTTKRTTTHLNKSHDDDEWSDFISSAPVSSNLTNPSSNFAQLTNNVLTGNQNQWNCTNKSINSLTTNQQILNHNNIFVPSQQQEKPHVFLNSNNNKISQYLLNNASAAQADNHINGGSNNMQLNSLKPNDFIPHHHFQHQVLQKQQKILSQSTSNGSNIIGNNISFIPDLGFSSPQNQFINMTKRNYQRK